MQKFDSKKKSETRGKNGQVSEVELGVLAAHLKKKETKKKREKKGKKKDSPWSL